MISIQTVYSQACGIYRIKYVGQIKSNELEVTSIKLPTTMYLHGLEKRKSKRAFFEYSLENDSINIEMHSHLSCHIHGNPNLYLELYLSKHKSLSIILVGRKNDEEIEIPIELEWKNIKMTKIEDDGFGYLMEINLSKIEI